MKTSDFDYDLPQEMIAQTPAEPRDHSRLMVVSRSDGTIGHHHFYDLPDLLRRDDLLVFNDSRVMPARLYGRRTGSGGKVEILLLRRISPGVWRALVRPGRRMRAGTTFEVDGGADSGKVSGEIVQVEPDGTRLVKLSGEEHLHDVGVVPLPPYIHEPLKDAERYQTVYSRIEGSVAAPTAGLHFTVPTLERLGDLGIETVFVTLHVGWDSFRPVDEDDPASHEMHSEYWELSQEAADAINRARSEGRRIVSVGTTAVRLLESAAHEQGSLAAGSGWADLLILPGYRFRVVDALLTNFHLPKSTLLMLTSALAGRDLVFHAYHEAIAHNYRFYSFGDAMLIL
jgi:S-adenosylmethionine:tRNA ribosyltransferase-isomerase